MNILITGIGGPTPRSIARRIKNIHPDYKLYGVDTNKKAIGFYLEGLLENSRVIPRADNSEYWKEIKRIVKDLNIELAFVQPEQEVIEWGKYEKENNDLPVPCIIPPLEFSEALVDKSIMSAVLGQTEYIPKTLKINQDNIEAEEIKKYIGYPCWIRATKGSGGFGSLKIENEAMLKSWLFISREIQEFTISEYLPGRHIANQMLYYNGKYIKGASLECAEYVMASIAPSKVTGNTSYGKFINEDKVLEFCDNCIQYISKKLNVPAHGVFSFDLKEDLNGMPKVTEINVRHMAYTGIMAEVGFDLIDDSISILTKGIDAISHDLNFSYDKDYSFLRDVDIEPIVLNRFFS